MFSTCVAADMQANHECSVRVTNFWWFTITKLWHQMYVGKQQRKYRIALREFTSLFDTRPYRDFHSMQKLSRHTRGFVASNEQLRSLDSLQDKKINSGKVWNGRDQPTLFCHGICRMNAHFLLVMQVYGLDLCIYYMRH